MRVAVVVLILAMSGCLAPPTSPPPVTDPLPDPLPGGFSVDTSSFPSFDAVKIAYTVFQPEGTGPQRQVPVVLHSHGWGASRLLDASADIQPLLDAGFGVVSFDARGHGESGGEARLVSPDHEARDVLALVDLVATWDWVLLDAPGDPRIGAVGYSYAGAYQWVAALEETRTEGATRFDALAPQITWNDLVTSLGQNGVPKGTWLTVLLGFAAGGSVRMAPDLPRWYAQAMATGELPDDAVEAVHRAGSAWYAENGVRLAIPVLIQQGATDTLFPLNEAWANWQTAITPEARAASFLVTHRNGHAAPILQQSTARPENPCAKEDGWFAPELQAKWFRRVLLGEAVELGAPIQLATHEGRCLTPASLPPLASPVSATPTSPAGTIVPLSAGARVALPLAKGPLTLAGIPRLEASVTGLHPDARLFFALGIGTSGADARVAGDQWMPVRGAPDGRLDVATDLVGVVEEVQAGQSLFLLVGPQAEAYALQSSRAGGIVVLTDATVALPVLTE